MTQFFNGHGHLLNKYVKAVIKSVLCLRDYVFQVITVTLWSPSPRIERSQEQGGHATRTPQKYKLKVRIHFVLVAIE